MATTIDIFAGLRRVSAGKGGKSQKVVIEFRAPSLVAVFDENAIAKELAETCAAVMRDNMLSGKTPSGTPLPVAKASTIRRRKYREQQALRDGDVSPRFKRTSKASRKFYRNAKRSYFKRYKTRLGTFQPGSTAPRGLFGVESGLLAKNLVGVPAGPGRYHVVTANARSMVDRSGKSAMTRVFGSGRIAAWSKHAMSDPRVQESLRRAQASIFRRSARGFVQALRQTAANTASLVNTAADYGDE